MFWEVNHFRPFSIDKLIVEIEKVGGHKADLTAKLIGGARMFKVLSGDKEGIGSRNVEAAKTRLVELKIPIEKEDTGSTIGRNAELNIRNGIVNVYTKM